MAVRDKLRAMALRHKLQARLRVLRGQISSSSNAGDELPRLGTPSPNHKQGCRLADDPPWEPRFPFTILAVGFDGTTAFVLLCYERASEDWDVCRLPRRLNNVVAAGGVHFGDNLGSV